MCQKVTQGKKLFRPGDTLSVVFSPGTNQLAIKKEVVFGIKSGDNFIFNARQENPTWKSFEKCWLPVEKIQEKGGVLEINSKLLCVYDAKTNGVAIITKEAEDWFKRYHNRQPIWKKR